MKSQKFTIALLLVGVILKAAAAGDFSTDAWRGESRYLQTRYAPSVVPTYSNQAYPQRVTYPPVDSNWVASKQSASNWVERDPRYLMALPTIQKTSYYAPAATPYQPEPYNNYYGATTPSCAAPPPLNVYGTSAPLAYGATTYESTPYGASPYGVSPYGVSPHIGPLPRGYYKGDGLFGKDTVYAKNQPIRNFFRFLVP